jgi:hypothetical protein
MSSTILVIEVIERLAQKNELHRVSLMDSIGNVVK